MKKPLLLLACFFILIISAKAQQLKGVITDKKGVPVANSTVYIHENAKGIVADDLGEFQIMLEAGVYTCEFRSLGYETVKQSIAMGAQNQVIRVELPEKSYLLREVVVRPGKEDPAYRIMRRAIAYAPYYRYQVKKYTSEAYIKGSLTIEKVPALLRRSMKANDADIDINSLIGKPLLLESKSNIRFTSPQTYDQQVVALKSSIPKEFNAMRGLSITTSSIYDAELGGCISPLSQGAFRFYAFKLEDVDYQSDVIINKIKVLPRKKNPQLFSGYLYILENTWNVYIADLTTSEFGTTMHHRINYNQVKPSVYLPTTYDITMTINTLGVKGAGKYYASMKYNSVEVDNTRLPSAVVSSEMVVDELVMETPSPKQEKIIAQIEKLAQKEELSTRDAYRMGKLMAQAAEPEAVKLRREELEIKDIELVKMSVDSLALKKDSLYWAVNRETPLRDDEMRSYQHADSVAATDTALLRNGQNADGLTISVEQNPKTVFGRVVQGGYWKMGKNTSLRYGGLSGGVKEYNFVDGLWLGQTVTLRHAIDSAKSITFSPSVYYATARKQALWHVNASLNYAPMRLGWFSLSGGHISRDINGTSGESRWLNSFAASWLGQNFIRFYDSRYIKAQNSIDIANGLHLYSGIEIDRRRPLSNRTTFNFAKKQIPENIPADAAAYPEHTATKLSLSVTYTPQHRYRVVKGRKWYAESRYPTFTLSYEKGIDILGRDNPTSLYDKLWLAFAQEMNVSPFDKMDYLVSVGGFISAKNLQMNDFAYFRNSRMLFTIPTFERTFHVLPAYTAAQKWWVLSHFTYQSQYLLLKNLPFLQSQHFDEAVHVKGLLTETKQLYLEGGYSVGFLGMGRVGAFVGFTGKNFEGVGVKIQFPMFNIFEKPLK